MKRKVRVVESNYWFCRVMRVNRQWCCVRKQVNTPFYVEPVDEVLKRFKSRRLAHIFADMVNIQMVEDCLEYTGRKGKLNPIAFRKINVIYNLCKHCGYRECDLVISQDLDFMIGSITHKEVCEKYSETSLKDLMSKLEIDND